jgi:hypothetical protein
MSHHFDTQVAKDDSRLNILDMYLFAGAAPDTTAMILTTNPDAGIFAPLTLHPEGIYAFRFDISGDATEDVVFKFVFEEPHHVGGNPAEHAQRFRVVSATGDEIPGARGQMLAEGIGRAAELWAADAFGFFTFVNSLFTERRYAADAFKHGNNLFQGRNNMATVLEIPNSLLQARRVHAWATASLCGHAPEVQVYRWGVPLLTHLYLSKPDPADLAQRFHQTAPVDDAALFGSAVAEFVKTLSTRAGRVKDPASYASMVIPRLIPAMLPYDVGSDAEFSTVWLQERL